MPLSPTAPPRSPRKPFRPNLLRRPRPFVQDSAQVIQVGASSSGPVANTMTLGSGTFSLTVEQEHLKLAAKLSDQVGTFSLTDEQFTIKLAALLKAQSGSFTLTVENEAFKHAAKLNSQAGTYALTDEQLSLKAAIKQSVQSGTFALTDETVTFKAAYKQIVSTGTYTLTGEALAAKVALHQTLQSGSFALTGENEALKAAVLYKLQSGQFALTGENLKFTLGAHQSLSAVFYGLNSSWPSSGLLDRWPLDSAHLSGGVDSDTFGTNTITESGTVTSATGPSGSANGARSFDGNSGYGSFASSPLPVTGPYTVLMWANPTDITAHAITGVNLTLLNLGTNGTGNNQIRLTLDNGDTNVAGGYAWWAIPSANKGTATAVFADGVWAQFGLTFDGTSTYQTVFNGVVISPTAAGPNPPSAFNQIASRNGASPFFPGSLARLTIYNRVLSAAELAQSYNAELGGPGATEQLTLTAGQHLTLNVGAGSYTLTVEQLALALSARLSPTALPYNLTVEPETLKAAWRVNATAGSYTFNGQNITAPVARRVSVATGSFALTGEAVAQFGRFALSASTATYSLNGEQLSATAARTMSVASVPYALTGESLRLFNPAGIHTLSIGSGSFAITGNAVAASFTTALQPYSVAYALNEPALSIVGPPPPTPPAPPSVSTGGTGGGGLGGYFYLGPQAQPIVIRPTTPMPCGTGLFGVAGGSIDFRVNRKAAFEGLPASITPTDEEMELLRAVLLTLDNPPAKKLALDEDEEIMLILASEL